MIVVDASVLAPALADDGIDGDRARARLAAERLLAPEILDVEVVSVWRGAARAGRLDARRVGQALADLAALPVERASHRLLLGRIWELRDELTTYGAAYVALAERLDATLLTADRAISRARGVECDVEVLG